MAEPRPILTAAWRYLAMLNYEVPHALLAPLVPAGTELDTWGGAPLASIIGFRFLETRVLGIPIPAHRDFDEVNLRFYVRRRGEDGACRAVVFIRELVPRRAIAAGRFEVAGALARRYAAAQVHVTGVLSDGKLSLTLRVRYDDGGSDTRTALLLKGVQPDFSQAVCFA